MTDRSTMTPILASHMSMALSLPRRLHQQIERRVQRGSTLRSTLVRDLERYYLLMEQYGARARHDDHSAFIAALTEIDLSTRTPDDLHQYHARAMTAIMDANLHLVYGFDLVALSGWLRAETDEPITFIALLDLLDQGRNMLDQAATVDT